MLVNEKSQCEYRMYLRKKKKTFHLETSLTNAKSDTGKDILSELDNTFNIEDISEILSLVEETRVNLF